MKLLFVVNPRSGRGAIREDLMECIDICCKAGFETTVYITQRAQDAERITKECAPRFDRLLCAGGDGTLDEVVNGMMSAGCQVPIGYLPTGTTNDFARSLGLPVHAVDAAGIAMHGKPFSLDVGQFNDRFFTYVAAFGAFTEVSYTTPQPYKNLLGHAAYVLEGIRTLPAIKACHAVVQSDDAAVEGDFIYGMVTNAATVGGVLPTSAEDIELDDGLFEVLLVRQPENAVQLQGIINLLLMQDMTSDMICHFKSASITIEMREEVPWTLDGEFGGRLQRVKIENHRQAVTVLIPQSEEYRRLNM